MQNNPEGSKIDRKFCTDSSASCSDSCTEWSQNTKETFQEFDKKAGICSCFSRSERFVDFSDAPSSASKFSYNGLYVLREFKNSGLSPAKFFYTENPEPAGAIESEIYEKLFYEGR